MSLTANFMSQLILLTGATATSPAQRLSAAFYLMKLLPATESQSEIYSSLSPSHCLFLASSIRFLFSLSTAVIISMEAVEPRSRAR